MPLSTPKPISEIESAATPAAIATNASATFQATVNHSSHTPRRSALLRSSAIARDQPVMNLAPPALALDEPALPETGEVLRVVRLRQAAAGLSGVPLSPPSASSTAPALTTLGEPF